MDCITKHILKRSVSYVKPLTEYRSIRHPISNAVSNANTLWAQINMLER